MRNMSIFDNQTKENDMRRQLLEKELAYTQL